MTGYAALYADSDDREDVARRENIEELLSSAREFERRNAEGATIAEYLDTVSLATDGSGTWQPLSISVGHYGNGLRLVELATILGDYRIFTAPTAGSRWHLARSGRLPGCPTRTGFCLALEGHPELSTATKTFARTRMPMPDRAP